MAATITSSTTITTTALNRSTSIKIVIAITTITPIIPTHTTNLLFMRRFLLKLLSFLLISLPLFLLEFS